MKRSTAALGRLRLRLVFGLLVTLLAAGCGGGDGGPAAPPPPDTLPKPTLGPKSAKRGIAYDLWSEKDLAALAPGVSWWYNWSPTPSPTIPANYASKYAMDFVPMLWNFSFDSAKVAAYLKANPGVKYILVLNEPNLTDQANTKPADAAALWPKYEALAAATGVKIVGPAISWGTLPGYQDPVAWLDAFYAAYRAANGGRDPQIDYLAFHWYDYGLAGQLDRLAKYHKSFWVTELANWHNLHDGADVNTLALQQAQMTDMVATCESRSDVFRYAWFTGRLNPDPHYSSVLAELGHLSPLGATYVALPFTP